MVLTKGVPMPDAHTPGPWTVSQPWSGFSSIKGPEGQLIFGLAAGGADEARPADECEANARLIAAAPDLLEALKAVSDMLMARPDVIKALSPLMGFAEDAAFHKASVAIAKAEGRSAASTARSQDGSRRDGDAGGEESNHGS